ncbi:DNA-binding IclR family transcriptional regulator [Saccharothrix tamanrassetensis]|uniref:DNA-binding IclR family transcriptional regulator n=1 Tax=Saccharothrix tamanrassetensis TaxID=1051531 RepID=A0A841CKA5_9PSEU|nr:helix-turn-helix domain-containing protein [Saccharothrix tamanrassetensis]MBB5958932.1 DNA-binding IclR family transcriptional regulator [Saccharothrix tamanrassetensis]
MLEGAFALLEELARVEEAGLTRLAAGAGLPKATAHRLLDQLVTLGAVQRRAGRYRMGSRMFRLGQAWQPDTLLRVAARRPLRELATAFDNASVGVSMSEAGRSLLVAGLRGEVDQIRPWRAGLQLPPGCAADILTAATTLGMPPPECYSTKEWKKLTADARARGVAFDYDSVPWASCVAAPVHAPSGEPVGAVGAAVFDGRRLTSIAAAVQRAADMISANLAPGRWHDQVGANSRIVSPPDGGLGAAAGGTGSVTEAADQSPAVTESRAEGGIPRTEES